MALTESNPLPIGMTAANFHLRDVVSDNYYSLDDLKSDKATVVMFICNHCPFVIHVNSELVKMAQEYRNHGVSFIAINANDVEAYPEDAPDKMSIVAKVLRYPFPYLFDKSQDVARAYDAACTPDFYVFDGAMRLTYHGRLDASRPGNGLPVDGRDLREAIDKTIVGQSIETQYPSVGCNIKWKPGLP